MSDFNYEEYVAVVNEQPKEEVHRIKISDELEIVVEACLGSACVKVLYRGNVCETAFNEYGVYDLKFFDWDRKMLRYYFPQFVEEEDVNKYEL